MQYGLVKYDQWEDLIWVYNSIDSYIRTPLTAALVGISQADREVKYANCIMPSQDSCSHVDHGNFHPFCGCHVSGLNAIQPHEMGLIISTTNGIDILNRDSERRMRVMSEQAQMQVTNRGVNHIACSLLECSKESPRMVVSSNSYELFTLDPFRGQLTGKMQMVNPHAERVPIIDQITVLADMNTNMSRNTCMQSYCHNFPEDSDDSEVQYQSLDYAYTNPISKKESSLEKIAMAYGSVDAIPEFVPTAKASNAGMGTMKRLKMSPQRTSGAISLEYAMECQKETQQTYGLSRHLTCVGMLSGYLHIIDHRMQKIAYTIASHTNAVSTISAYGNYIVSTGCSTSVDSFVYEPTVDLHDMRMEKTRSIWLGTPICTAKIVKGSNKIIALKQDGGFFECDIKTPRNVNYPNLSNQSGWNYQDVDIIITKGAYSVYTSDEAYVVHGIEIENEDTHLVDMAPCALKQIFQKVELDKAMPQNDTLFGSMMGTFEGDVAQVFIQVFYFLPQLSSLRYHCCEVEHCLSCQVGFALHMLHVTHENRKNGHMEEAIQGRIVKSSAMQITQLQELMPVYKSETRTCGAQRLLIWLIEKLNSELDNFYTRLDESSSASAPHLIKSVFSFSKSVESTCANGHTSRKTVENELVMDYKHVKCGDSYGEVMECYCINCCKPVNTTYKISFITAPNLMIVRCNPEEISQIEESITFKGNTYRIMTIVFSVPAEDMNSRVLAYVRVPEEMKVDQQWLLINEGYVFVLSKDDEAEMFDFTPRWKQAIALIYRKDKHGPINEIVPTMIGDVTVANLHGRIVPLPPPDLKMPIPSSIFTSEYNIAHNPRAHNKSRTFVPLSAEELVHLRKDEFILALDVECVKTGNETTGSNKYFHIFDNTPEYDAGNMPLINTFVYSNKFSEERQLSTLARVSAVRGSGDAAGVPFLDHYIHRRKPPKDYLTRFSGIHRGDLDLKSSIHWLTTKKAIYMKLRYLIDAGCKIIGHGLDQDLKILNIVVPKEQIIDTVELFRLPGKRYISLQFLAAHVLNRRIQQGEHDSVEDANTALDLYRKYQEFKINGQIDDLLKSLYDIGYRTNWRVF